MKSTLWTCSACRYPSLNDQGVGLVSAAAFVPAQELPAGTTRVMPFELEVHVPSGPDGVAIELAFRDGLAGGGAPVRNGITYDRTTLVPELGDFVFQVRARGTDEPASFLRGDCNGDGGVDISDASFMLNWLFLGGATPNCVAIANTNGDHAADISDASYLLNFLFLGGPPPAPPYPDCGTSELGADAALGCVETSEHCP